MSTAAILFGHRETSTSFKALFFRISFRDWTETREQLPGPCYPNPKILLLRDPLLLLVPSTILSYEDKLHPWAIDDMARPLHYISPTMCWNCTSRGLRNSTISVSFRKASPGRFQPFSFARSSTNANTSRRKSWDPTFKKLNIAKWSYFAHTEGAC